MTSTSPPHHMYAGYDTHFRDPFGSKDFYGYQSRANWYSCSPYPDFNRALTPPPDMNGVSQPSKPNYHQQEYGHHYSSYMPNQQSHRAPYQPQEVSNSEFGRNGIVTQPSSRNLSPKPTSRLAVYDDAPQVSQQRRASQANAIAPSFQIPKSVNDSGGSLSELAAEVSSVLSKAHVD